MSGFEDILFENRNKKYGSYQLRKKSLKYLVWGLVLSLLVVLLLVGGLFVIYNSDLFFSSDMSKTISVESMQITDIQDLALPEFPPPAQEKATPDLSNPLIVDSTLQKPRVSTADKKEDDSVKKDSSATKGMDTSADGKGNLPPGDSILYVGVDELPSFYGGMDEFTKFIRSNISETTKNSKVRIKARVIFTVTRTGDTKEVTVFSGINPMIDKDIERVLNMLPRWKPARQGGRPVPVRCSLFLNL